uniref:Chalcone-flavonone isomerase family protein n=1 Tax=Physcomitrium patens TaxID=3218 RepID=UPI002493D000|nr:Chain A, Chalcone-flavonone isomerase family protein [Physcomitrium patens]
RGSHGGSMGPQVVKVEDIDFATKFTPPTGSTELDLIGYGNTGMEIETVEIRFTAIGFYAEPSISEHLQKWKGTPSSNLVEDDSGFHKELIQAPVEKAVRISIIKGIKGLPYGSALQSSLRDRLVNNDLFEEEEEEALEKLAEFFQPHNLPKGTNIIYHWATPSSVKVSLSEEGKMPEDVAYTIDDAHVAEALLDLYLGENTITPSTLASVAEAIAA